MTSYYQSDLSMLQSFAPDIMQLDLKITFIINWFYFSREEKRQVVINKMKTFPFSLFLAYITSERTYLISKVLPLQLDVNGQLRLTDCLQ